MPVLDAAAEDAMDAVKRGDTSAFKAALKDFFDICSSGGASEDEGDDSYE